MIRVATLLAALLAAVFVVPDLRAAQDHTVEAGDLTIVQPTARPNLPNRPAAVYVTITNGGAAADRLIAVSAPDFDSAEIHLSSMTGGVMSMDRVDFIDLPGGDTVELAPGGYHIMLFGATKLFKPGDVFGLVLTFEKQGDVAVEVMVEKLDPSQMGGHKEHGTMQMPKATN